MRTSSVGVTRNRLTVRRGSGPRPAAVSQTACLNSGRRRRKTPPQAGGLPHSGEAGVSLLELLVVVVLIAIVAGLTFPSAAAGVDSLRLRSASDRIVNFLDTAIERAGRRQQVVELRIAPAENALSARTADLTFDRTLAIPDFIRITSIEPEVAAGDSGEQRRFLIYPGGTAPRIRIQLESKDGRKRRVTVDPLTGMPHAEAE